MAGWLGQETGQNTNLFLDDYLVVSAFGRFCDNGQQIWNEVRLAERQHADLAVYMAHQCPSGRLVVCEGYATGATLHEETGHAVAVAFNAANLLPVAQALRAKFPRIALVVASDDDWQTEGNPGLTAATEAARAIGGRLAVPDFTGYDRSNKDTDFNDLQRLHAELEGA